MSQREGDCVDLRLNRDSESTSLVVPSFICGKRTHLIVENVFQVFTIVGAALYHMKWRNHMYYVTHLYAWHESYMWFAMELFAIVTEKLTKNDGRDLLTFVCVCVCVCMYVCMCVLVCLRGYKRVYKYVCVCVYIYVNSYIHKKKYKCTNAFLYIWCVRCLLITESPKSPVTIGT